MAKRVRKNTWSYRGDPAIVTVHNANFLVVEGVERIVFCDSDKMILKNRFFLKICGEELCLRQLGNDNIAVKGKILSISFARDLK